jgi:hypothetical protein
MQSMELNLTIARQSTAIHGHEIVAANVPSVRSDGVRVDDGRVDAMKTKVAHETGECGEC